MSELLPYEGFLAEIEVWKARHAMIAEDLNRALVIMGYLENKLKDVEELYEEAKDYIRELENRLYKVDLYEVESFPNPGIYE